MTYVYDIYIYNRSKWLSFCEYFLMEYQQILNSNNNTSSTSTLVNILQILMHLLTFADAFSNNINHPNGETNLSPREIYSILEELQIVPSKYIMYMYYMYMLD